MSSTRVPITGDGSAIISSSLDVELVGVGDVPLELYYDIKGTVEFVRTHGYHKVALQFPDDLLRDAPAVVQALHAGVPDAQFFVLGDTSYGSCCVDEVAAAHASVEAIVHYGPACLSPYVGGSGDGGGGPAPAWLCVCVCVRAQVQVHVRLVLRIRWQLTRCDGAIGRSVCRCTMCLDSARAMRRRCGNRCSHWRHRAPCWCFTM